METVWNFVYGTQVLRLIPMAWLPYPLLVRCQAAPLGVNSSKGLVMYQSHDFQSFWDRSGGDLITSDVESAARGPRMPRERPDRPGGGGGGNTGGTIGAATTYLSGDPNVPDWLEYNALVTFRGRWPAELKNAVIAAADVISDIITGDLPDVLGRFPIDDISLVVRLGTIDGVGGILARSGPTAFHDITLLPSAGTVTFDLADASASHASGLLDDTAMHEFLHALGFGTLWGTLGLIDGAGNFTGAFANAVYPGAAPIPLDGTGAHWDESVFGNELMTPRIDSDNELSYMTVASLGDLGYSVVLGASYVPPAFI
jgi:hypothetical protein